MNFSSRNPGMVYQMLSAALASLILTCTETDCPTPTVPEVL